MGALLLVLLSMLSFQETAGDAPKDVVDFFRSVAAALSDANDDGNARAFLEHFDPSMPGYVEFSGRMEEMVGAGEVVTTIDFINTKGDDRKKTLELDWMLQCEGQKPKRAVIQCTIEKRGKKWKITSLGPLEFFKRE